MALLGFVIVALLGCETRPSPVEHIIDVHRHGAWPGGDDAAHRDHTITQMRANGVRLAVVSLTDYEDAEIWKTAASDVFLASVMLGCPRNLAEPWYQCFPSSQGWVDVDWLRENVEAGHIEAIHEVLPNYNGVAVDDAQYDPYFALAAELDIPVGIHTQRGPPPGAPNSPRTDPNCCPQYDREAGNPALLRPVLERYPTLRVWIQHVGAGRPGEFAPFWPETLALLKDYPQVYVDLSITNGPLPLQVYEKSLRTLIDAGFGDRIMMGSDNLPLDLVLGRIRSIEWLEPDQRDAILYKNAERFFRLD
ncbi:MAG: amidohydrolase family protein [Pseudomonadota bacterium]